MSELLLYCPFCKKKPGIRTGPPAMARCITPECEGTKLAAYTFAEWNTHAAPPSTETPRRHTATPWELIEATGHHGAYIENSWGRTICDLYAMSNPMAASVRNGGTSFPVPFDDMAANAAFIVEACNSHAALTARVAELTAALRQIKAKTEGDRPTVNPENAFGHWSNLNAALVIIRGLARAALEAKP